jgi:hypothetical protein
VTIRTGSTRLSSETILANLISIIPYLVVETSLGGWDNIQGLSVKSDTSVALPFWYRHWAGDKNGNYSQNKNLEEGRGSERGEK